MNINKKIESRLKLKISDWELDFYSRPIIESNGKKRWELIICSTRSYKTEGIFLWNKKCPANEVNSVWLTKALNEAISEAKKQGWEKPSIVRFWRSSMKSIIKKSLEALSIEAIVSRRTYDLLDRIEFLEKEIYPKEKGYVRGVLAPTFSSKMENPPQPLPEAERGDALTISEISIGELKSAENWPMEFGDIFPIQQDLDDNYLVPGLRLFSKDRSLALSAWFSCLDPIKLIINKNQLLLEASENDMVYIKLDGKIGCMVNGAGLAMATMDIIKQFGMEPANFLDLGGTANKERAIKAFKIIQSDKNVKSVFINIFGGIIHCDMIANGIIEAVKELNFKLPIVVRFQGTNSKEGRDIINKSNLGMTSIDDFTEAAKKVVELAK